MSMISSQCDELRKLADGQARYRDAREVMLQAADTILELRNKCNDLMDERDELRHKNADMKRQLCCADEIIGRQSTKIEKAEAENAKLRSLMRKWYPHMLKRVGRDALKQWGQMDVVKELEIEVGE